MGLSDAQEKFESEMRALENGIARKPVWTREPPTEPGWFWVVDQLKPGMLSEPSVVRVERNHRGELVLTGTGDELRYPLSATWWGPKLTAPELPKDAP